MDITINTDRTVTLTMDKHMRDAIADAGMSIAKGATTPALKNLFDVDNEATPLDKEQGDTFHRVVAKLLYVAKRVRPDILLTVSFLCTHVSKCNEQDWTKLKRLLSYLTVTVDMTFTLGADSLDSIKTWVDALYAVHPDMRSHTGGMVLMGRGGILCKSLKQKLNTKSSTQAEVVGVSEFLPVNIWMQNFMKAQGYTIRVNKLCQDNKSVILLETNGRGTASAKSRHIDIKYYFVKD